MGKPVTKWVSDDGASFEDERSMILHELSLVDCKEIELFVKQYKERKQKEYASVLMDWQKYQRSNQSKSNSVPVRALILDNADDLFQAIPQGENFKEPDNYLLDNENAEIERSFQRATKI